MTVDQELFADRLPTYLTRFVGRESEIEAVVALLDRQRLVTLCGVGGAGKTRLAIEVAKRVREAPARGGRCPARGVLGAAGGGHQPAEVPAAVANGVSVTASVSGTITGLLHVLQGQHALLVLDNCEQVTAACRTLLDDLLPRCPQIECTSPPPGRRASRTSRWPRRPAPVDLSANSTVFG